MHALHAERDDVFLRRMKPLLETYGELSRLYQEALGKMQSLVDDAENYARALMECRSALVRVGGDPHAQPSYAAALRAIEAAQHVKTWLPQ